MRKTVLPHFIARTPSLGKHVGPHILKGPQGDEKLAKLERENLVRFQDELAAAVRLGLAIQPVALREPRPCRAQSLY
jgi:hypothetical protein